MNTSSIKQPAIVRIWRGRTPRDRADEDETEFVKISYWESVEAMSKFTGGDPRKVHHLERDKEFLIELPKEVQILRLLKSHGVTGSAARRRAGSKF